MPLDLSKIKPKKKEVLLIEPIEIFQRLKVNDPNINDLWLAQGDALREWHKNRALSDISIVLNTGAGKTLVGLIIAQSLVNESRGKVLYACSSIQLVKQTAEKALGYGMQNTTYYHGDFNNNLFHECKACCITTYQALFNGHSKFFNEEISAIIFDDAHAAEHLLRDHFSVQIKRSTFPSIYSQIVELFRDYFKNIGKIGSYEELEDSTNQEILLVPPFEIKKQFNELMRILTSADLTNIKETTFAWEHLKDKVDICCLLISGSVITITPPFVPVNCLSYFNKEIRRLYLSATLSASDAFARTFGRAPDKIIAPTTTAGECERLIIIPSRSGKVLDDLELTQKLIKKYKALILVPSYVRASKWEETANPPPASDVAEHIDKFKTDSGTEKLLLAARYDGLDLPGDTCRLMVIDDLPTGLGALDRYLWEYLNLSNSLRSAIASRIVQSFGRISRGMSDHGVVILTGEKLIRWLITPRNSAMLPVFLQKQISLGVEISEQLNSMEDFQDTVEKCFSRDQEWTNTYDNFIKEADPEIKEEIEGLTDIAKSEARYAAHMWNRDYESAAKCLKKTLEKAFTISISTGAWHALWLGMALEFTGDENLAKEMYSRAHGAQKNIPALPSHVDTQKQNNIPLQICEVDRQFQVNTNGSINAPKNIGTFLVHLDGSGTSAQTEESIRTLGQYLGLNSSRPDKEFGTGPDVLWVSPDMTVLCIDAKTGKKKTSNSKYKKEEIGQLSDHVQWVKNNIEAKGIIPIFVGPISSASSSANPPKDFKVIKLDQFHSLANRLVAALNDIASNSLHITLRSKAFEIFKQRGLLWPKCFEDLTCHNLCDL